MSKTNYNSQAELIAQIIDIAISCFRNTPPEGFDEHQIKQIINTYLDYKKDVLSPQPQYKNLASLNQIKNEVLTVFQESSSKTIETFWNEIEAKKLNIRRANPLDKIMKRGKIKNQIEYDTVIDLFTPYIQKNMLSQQEIDKINKMIIDFEKRVDG